MFLFVNLNSRSYNLSLGRARLNQKLEFVPNNYHKLTGQDILFASFSGFSKRIETADDIDDLQNRKIKPCGDLIQNH
jgi:DNA-directed RNA polymerase beta subunit